MPRRCPMAPPSGPSALIGSRTSTTRCPSCSCAIPSCSASSRRFVLPPHQWARCQHLCRASWAGLQSGRSSLRSSASTASSRSSDPQVSGRPAWPSSSVAMWRLNDVREYVSSRSQPSNQAWPNTSHWGSACCRRGISRPRRHSCSTSPVATPCSSSTTANTFSPRSQPWCTGSCPAVRRCGSS